MNIKDPQGIPYAGGIPFHLSRQDSAGRLNLERCRDYPALREVFTRGELDSYEKQLTEYLDTEGSIDTDSCNVPRIVCWYEGLISTVEFINEYGVIHKKTARNKKGGNRNEKTKTQTT